jgi:uncharacterized RDD family membrane protein YckC
MNARLTIEARSAKKRREMITPEGLALPIVLASRGTRLGALLLDLTIMFATMILVALVLLAVGINLFEADAEQGGALEFIVVIYLLAGFLLRQFYFMFFELGPRGATPGKRALGIRIASRNGGRLTAEAVVARNLLRDIELFVPLGMIMGVSDASSAAEIAAAIWLLVFALFPFFNRDRLRAGDIIAGTWVVEAPRRKLDHALSTSASARGHSAATGAQYRFGEAELSIYGEFELQTLERVLREGNHEAMTAVAEAICRKIGWSAGSGDEQAFLEAYYAQLRARLEGDMRFGKRKADKFA